MHPAEKEGKESTGAGEHKAYNSGNVTVYKLIYSGGIYMCVRVCVSFSIPGIALNLCIISFNPLDNHVINPIL